MRDQPSQKLYEPGKKLFKDAETCKKASQKKGKVTAGVPA